MGSYPLCIMENPYKGLNGKKSEELPILHEFWHKETEIRDPELISMDDVKNVIYHSQVGSFVISKI